MNFECIFCPYRDSERNSPSLGSHDSSISTADNADSSSLTTVQREIDDKRETASLNGSTGASCQVERADRSRPGLEGVQLRQRGQPQEPQPQRVVSESDDSSLNSELELDHAVYPDSDTGLESMSSAEAQEGKPREGSSTSVVVCAESGGLRHEITRLKCDKLDLLRQNVVSICFAYQKMLHYHQFLIVQFCFSRAKKTSSA